MTEKKGLPVAGIVLLVIGLAIVIYGATMAGGNPSGGDESNPWGNIDGVGGAVIMAVGSVPGLIGLWLLFRSSRWS